MKRNISFEQVAYAALGVAGGLKYTEAEYLRLNDILKHCASRLNSSSVSEMLH